MNEIGKINPGEGVPPFFYRKEKNKKVERVEEVTPDRHYHEDTVEISREAKELLEALKDDRPETEDDD
ncbi:TPA: hypothetical protein DHW58_01010 [Patescibacteria group bacterium]|uniref:Uncharacterized protein n=2 Tax=Bacteria division Kazan-3B-28 TaxID=1798534 RepID=A0A0G2A3L9_UNCK3|nr:MAG: hypothetical protein VE98_C0001G0242 [candidate division Kazan bacterium GW2011_GWA1_50_15]KKW25483.1 MAG: hypothetical protein VE99_C0001G0120 [candidate division Kazan bacterium GW2011_GWC1_52_13]KKW26789.1 MAG: hypothetical protein VF00_C0002G0114 [candidate division Kazan bacterium GW2011_GWB1_52_7]HAV65784.1 hypothetical protein [Patescibacteria group bacterium]HCL47550.1 hypothetical protein [Patescibacteria group bacterium]